MFCNETKAKRFWTIGVYGFAKLLDYGERH